MHKIRHGKFIAKPIQSAILLLNIILNDFCCHGFILERCIITIVEEILGRCKKVLPANARYLLCENCHKQVVMAEEDEQLLQKLPYTTKFFFLLFLLLPTRFFLLVIVVFVSLCSGEVLFPSRPLWQLKVVLPVCGSPYLGSTTGRLTESFNLSAKSLRATTRCVPGQSVFIKPV